MFVKVILTAHDVPAVHLCASLLCKCDQSESQPELPGGGAGGGDTLETRHHYRHEPQRFKEPANGKYYIYSCKTSEKKNINTTFQYRNNKHYSETLCGLKKSKTIKTVKMCKDLNISHYRLCCFLRNTPMYLVVSCSIIRSFFVAYICFG